ncbi:Coiled-coil domain-containing protein [Phytophthora cinnamomi]|uniref:Coiled-coil domain-containing protein n=1 Tax=Phytophthora cinnamomi TaxID=4785 RepID=UPI00355AC221|nr:Coiled-coil domain-containing protein [Phytophthora cinnamomi]
MNFPIVMALSLAMVMALDVAFRPAKLEAYDACVGFHVHVIEGGVAAVTGRFWEPFIARITALKVEIPYRADFCFCSTKGTTLQSFTPPNRGQMYVLFDMLVPAGEAAWQFVCDLARIWEGQRRSYYMAYCEPLS